MRIMVLWVCCVRSVSKKYSIVSTMDFFVAVVGWWRAGLIRFVCAPQITSDSRYKAPSIVVIYFISRVGLCFYKHSSLHQIKFNNDIFYLWDPNYRFNFEWSSFENATAGCKMKTNTKHCREVIVKLMFEIRIFYIFNSDYFLFLFCSSVLIL